MSEQNESVNSGTQSGKSLSAYLMGSCTENECRLCHTALYARTPDMYHTGISVWQPDQEASPTNDAAVADESTAMESPILAFHRWLERWVKDNGRKMTQTEYGIAYAAFIAAHPGEGPHSHTFGQLRLIPADHICDGIFGGPLGHNINKPCSVCGEYREGPRATDTAATDLVS